MGFDTDVELSPVDGLQLKVVAPFACSETDELAPDEQRDTGPLGVTVMIGVCVTFTVTEPVALHPLVVPVTV